PDVGQRTDDRALTRGVIGAPRRRVPRGDAQQYRDGVATSVDRPGAQGPPWAVSQRRDSPAAICPAPMPSSAANGPQGLGVIHTWIIGTSPNLTSGAVHEPPALGM